MRSPATSAAAECLPSSSPSAMPPSSWGRPQSASSSTISGCTRRWQSRLFSALASWLSRPPCRRTTPTFQLPIESGDPVLEGASEKPCCGADVELSGRIPQAEAPRSIPHEDTSKWLLIFEALVLAHYAVYPDTARRLARIH